MMPTTGGLDPFAQGDDQRLEHVAFLTAPSGDARAPRSRRGNRAIGRGRGAGAVAPLAVAADLVRVVRHPELLPAADLVLETLDVPALELDDGAAAETDHVVVVMAAEHRLVARLPLGHLDLVDEPGLDEAGKRAVERGARDGEPGFVEDDEQVLHVEVAAQPSTFSRMARRSRVIFR
jgi:hypothetical protein